MTRLSIKLWIKTKRVIPTIRPTAYPLLSEIVFLKEPTVPETAFSTVPISSAIILYIFTNILFSEIGTRMLTVAQLLTALDMRKA